MQYASKEIHRLASSSIVYIAGPVQPQTELCLLHGYLSFWVPLVARLIPKCNKMFASRATTYVS